MEIAEFLLARIAEDEATAKAASGGLDYNWGDYGINPELLVDARFFERFASPARVLARCAADRQIVEGLVEYMEGDYAPWNEDFLKLLALPYADHPDFRAEWKP